MGGRKSCGLHVKDLSVHTGGSRHPDLLSVATLPLVFVTMTGVDVVVSCLHVGCA